MSATLSPPAPSDAWSANALPDVPEDKREWAWVALILLAFLAINVLTADRYPFPFFDEVLYADPAINYVTGRGFTSAVRIDNAPVFYFYNGPAHSALLVPWLKAFGVSMRSVRSINFLYMAVTALLIWSAARRAGLVLSGRSRLLLIALLFCDYSIVFSCRCGRYDCLGMVIVAFAFWCFSIKSVPLRLAALALAGAASPWIGLQLLPLEAVLGGTLLAFTLLQYWREIAVLVGGIGAGGLGLTWFFARHHVLQYFLRFPVLHQVDLDQVLHSQSKGFGFFDGLFHGEFRHSNMLPKDFSLPLLLAAGVVLAVALFRQRSLKMRSELMFGLTFVPLFALLMILLAKFPTYYGWMIYLPLAICVCGSLDLNLPANARRLVVGLCVLACTVGVGLHVLAGARDWKDRDYSKVQEFVASSVHSDDWAFVDPQAYYPAKLSGAETFFRDPATMPSDEKKRFTVCVIDPDRTWVLNALGGTWYRTGQDLVPASTGLFGSDSKWGFLSLPNYRLSVYRRIPSAPPSGL